MSIGKFAVLLFWGSLLFLSSGCCSIYTVSENSWCLTEHRIENRKVQYSPEKHLLHIETDETAKAYFCPFDFNRKIPWTTVRHHTLTFPLDKLSNCALMELVFVESLNAPRVRIADNLPGLAVSNSLPAVWNLQDVPIPYYRMPGQLRIHPEDWKYLSGPFELRNRNAALLLIPYGVKNGKSLFYIPNENRLVTRTRWEEYHQAIVWRALWILPAAAIDLVFWPAELIWLAVTGV